MLTDTDAYDAAQCARRLHDFGIDLPPDAEAALARLNQLRDAPPPPPAHNAVAQLYADDAKPAAINAAIAERLGYQHRADQHKMAQNILGRRVLDAVMADRDRIHSELKAQADECITRIEFAAQLDETVLELTQQRRVNEAHALSVVESDCEVLRACYYVRNEWLTTSPGPNRWSTGWWSCETWANPWDVARNHVAENDGSRWGLWRATIRAGGKMVFWTHEQATAESRKHEPGNVLPPINPVRAGATFVG